MTVSPADSPTPLDGPALPPDPAGVFASDVHRRVLAHLSTPEDNVGYSVSAQIARTGPDVHVPFSTPAEIEEVLGEPKEDGLAVEHEGGLWQMTEKGFKKLTGEATKKAIQNLPKGPARIDRPTPLDPTKKAE